MRRSGVLLLAKVVGRSRMTGGFVKKIYKLGFKLENESYHRSPAIVEIPRKRANSAGG